MSRKGRYFQETIDEPPAGGGLMSEAIDTLCATLSLPAVAQHYANLADEAAQKKRSYVAFLEQVLQAEASLRAERSRQMLVKLATFPVVKTLEDFDFETAAGVPKARPSSSDARTVSCWALAA